MDQVITSLESILIKTAGQVMKAKIEADKKNHANQVNHANHANQANHSTHANNPKAPQINVNTVVNHPTQVKQDPKKAPEKKHEQPKKVEHHEQPKKLMDQRWVSIAKLQQPLKLFKEAIHNSEASKTIKKELNCQSFRLRRVYVKKNFKGYMYWLHIDVVELGNAGQYTVVLRQVDGQLQVLDIQDSLLCVTKCTVPLPVQTTTTTTNTTNTTNTTPGNQVKH